MFTGIVTDLGRVDSTETSAEGSRLRIRSALVPKMEIGHSVAVNGACLTVVATGGQTFDVEATPETLRLTNLGDLAVGSPVNLELSVRLSDFLGGHLVQGHVDELGRVASIREEGNSWIYRFSASPDFLRYCVYKGSVTVDGVSLTISGLGERWFEVAIIPHTHEVTTFSALAQGDAVNLEADLISKYVESHVRRLRTLAVLFLVLFLSWGRGLAGELALQSNSILIYANSNAAGTQSFVIRVARPSPDLVFEGENVNDQGTVHVYRQALEESLEFTLLQLFEVGVDQDSPDRTTLQLSRAAFEVLERTKRIKLRLNGTFVKMKVVGEESFSLAVDRETVEVKGLRVEDDRRGSWLFARDPERPLVLHHKTPYFEHRLKSLSTPDRPSLRWIRRLPPIK